ncbi:MAG: glycosyl hydrolase [Saprospiraceae bacterium]|nr:glycosyl hydrolase [Saprospiraceae bacterium]
MLTKTLINLTIVVLIMGLLPLNAQKKSNKKTDKAVEKVPEKKDDPYSSATFSALTFRSIGPAVTSGRVSDFAVNPKNHSEYYVASASGGVWKTTNRGVNYQPIFDGQGSYSIGCVSLDPNNASTVWVGTGENNNQRSVAYGDGVYKSSDGGASWKNMGLKNSEHISQIIVDPKDPDVIYVGAYGPVWGEGGDRGVYKSTDGGATWNCVKSVSPFTGCNDLVMDPGNNRILYAAFHQRMRKVYTYIGGGPESALYKSSDAGATWNKMEGGLPGGDIGRIALDISPVNPDMLYAVVEAKDAKGGIYRTINRGASWEKRSGTFTSGNYYQEVTCDPHNADKIYITDTYYKVSTDGGKTVSNLGEINKHIDNHAIWVDPRDPNHFIVGCDGGIYETFDHAKSYDYKDNLPVTQFYKVSTDNESPFYSVHGGTQDNLSLGGPSRTTSVNGITNADWYITSLGDGFETQVDQSNPNIIYAQSQYGGLVRFDRKSGEYLPIKPIEGENDEAHRWNWDAPLLISKFDNNRLYFGANKVFRTDDQGNSWKVISPDLSRQIDRNKLEIMGKVWSVDAIAKNGSTDIFGQTTSIAESPLDENMIWVGTDDGLIQLTTDGGKNWIKMDNLPGVPEMSYVHQIIASIHDKNTAFVCFNHHRYGDFKPYLLKTTDKGKTWKSIASDLPERGSVYTIAEDHVEKDLLFAGTEFGCFFTSNGGSNWLQLKSGLPTIAVRDIEIQRRENDLVLGTFGRGFYILDDYTPLRYIKKEDLAKEALICPVKDALMYVPRYPLGLRDKGHLGSGYFSTPNPEMGAVFTWYLKDEIKKLKDIRKDKEKTSIEKKEKVYYPSLDSLRLEDNQTDPFLLFTITDAAGNIVRHIKAPASKGLHRTSWDFRYAPSDPVNNRYTPAPDQLFGSAPQGHLVMPGTYQVSLSRYQDGILTSLAGPVSFQAKLLNQASLPAKNLMANVSFYQKVSDMSKMLSATNDILSRIEERVKNAELAILDMPAPASDLLSKTHGVTKALIPLKLKLFGDNTRSSREFETIPSVNDRVYGIIYSVWNTTSDIPETLMTSFSIAEKQYDVLFPMLKELDTKVTEIEVSLNRNKAPYTPGRWPDKK